MKPSKYACPNPNCRSVFAWKRNLTSHLRYQCGQQPRFKCPYCEYKCKVKTDIRKHIKTKHKNRDVYVIDVFQSWQLLQWETHTSLQRVDKFEQGREEEIHFSRFEVDEGSFSSPFLDSRQMFRVKLSAVEEEGLIFVDVSHATKPFFLPLSCVSWLQGICVDYYANVLTTSQSFRITFRFFLPLLLFEIRERQLLSKNMLEKKVDVCSSERRWFFFSPLFEKGDRCD